MKYVLEDDTDVAPQVSWGSVDGRFDVHSHIAKRIAHAVGGAQFRRSGMRSTPAGSDDNARAGDRHGRGGHEYRSSCSSKSAGLADGVASGSRTRLRGDDVPR